jgi:hypothetical protein
MIESVIAAVEVKSSLDKSEIDDIFEKSAKLRVMRSARSKPLVTAFAYDCPNPNLSFLDFSVSFYRTPELSPSSVCLLNQHIFALAQQLGDSKLTPQDEPSSHVMPVLYTPREDTLLVYLHFLSQWVTAGTTAADAFLQYSQNVFSKMTAFHFDLDFLKSITSDEALLNSARRQFERKANEEIGELYKAA